jgi:arginyl-tRNA--protein-N-Asp/Glu arginylyltransferase
MEYLHWDEKTITDLSEKGAAAMYDRGYVFTRIGKGVMHQTRSIRIDLSKFELSSENRRVLKKVGGEKGGANGSGGISLRSIGMPLKEYDFAIGKLAKDFYDTKFNPGIMSAQKVKEMLTDPVKSNFNSLLAYSNAENVSLTKSIGFVICYADNDILHYSYPFYDLNTAPKDMGLGMMTMAIESAKARGLKYVYLGSLQRPTDTYKLQFAGLEWFDGGKGGSQAWSQDIERVKAILARK